MTKQQKEKKALPETHIITGDVRLAFPSVFKQKPRARGSDKTAFQATILLPPDTDLTPYHTAMKAALVAKFGKAVKLDPSKNPIRDAGSKEYDGFVEGWNYISLNNPFRQPAVVDALGRPVTDETKVYAGMWVRALISAYAWKHQTGGSGVSFSLEALQLVRDDDRLDGRVDTFNVFEPIAGATDADAGSGLFGDEDDADSVF